MPKNPQETASPYLNVGSRNGLGGGHYVREGVAFLNAYAKALGMSRRAFVHLLRNAPGTLMTCWRESMQLSELREIGEA